MSPHRWVLPSQDRMCRSRLFPRRRPILHRHGLQPTTCRSDCRRVPQPNSSMARSNPNRRLRSCGPAFEHWGCHRLGFAGGAIPPSPVRGPHRRETVVWQSLTRRGGDGTPVRCRLCSLVLRCGRCCEPSCGYGQKRTGKQIDCRRDAPALVGASCNWMLLARAKRLTFELLENERAMC